MKIVSVIGVRPQFIKYAPLSREMRRFHQEILVHTGQHYDYNMYRVFFNDLGIPEPDYNLEVGSGTHAYQTGAMLKGIEDIVIKEKPDLLLVYGDTNSTLAGALAAAKLHVSTGHVEAGVRSFDKSMPEEINRVLVDHCTHYLFCPTLTATENLKREGITQGVYLVGDLMVDSLNDNHELIERSHILSDLNLTGKNYLLVTVHRESNTDMPHHLENIANALLKLAALGEKIVFPLHPRTKKLLLSGGLYSKLQESVTLVDPLGYFDFLKLLSHSSKVLTDSGGIQKEAYILKIPCITLRENTEWIETIHDKWNILAGTDTEKIVELTETFHPVSEQRKIFGEHAGRTIVNLISSLSI